MSAWRIGTGGGSPIGTLDEGGPDLGKYFDAVAKWIPGDIMAFYLAAVTLISGTSATGRPSVSLWLAAAAATAILILLAALKAKRGKKDTTTRIGLGVTAFFVWSAVIPQSGWFALSWSAENPRAMTLAAALVGIVFAQIADLIVHRD
ncbi:hypothetical protein GR927_28370 [Mycolicibacterium sp. 3033]|nr:hypothetical protein [Mycolicibacterium aurantiacum]